MNTSPTYGQLGTAESLEQVLCIAFPFFVVWDEELRLKNCGASFRKICTAAELGKPLTELLSPVRNSEVLRPDFLKNSQDLLLLFSISNTEILYRGQILWFPDSRCFLMLGGPWINDPDEVLRAGLSQSDFAVHDQTMDLIQVLQSQRMANQDLQRLTERLREQREQMRQREAETRKLSLVAAKTASAAIITDADGYVEWVNDGFVRLTEWTLEEAKGKKPGLLLHGPETSETTKEYMRQKISKREGFSVEILNYTKTGKKYWIASEIQPVFDESGTLTNFMGVGNDITMRVKEDERRSLRHSVTKILAEGASLPAASFQIVEVISTKLRAQASFFWSCQSDEASCQPLAFWNASNPRYAALMDTVKSQCICCCDIHRDFRHGEEKAFWVESIRALKKWPNAEMAEKHGLRSAIVMVIENDGDTLGSAIFLCDPWDKPDDLMIQTLNGISFQLGQFLVRKRSEVEMRRAKEMAEKANQAKTEFLAMISHEIRTPMNGVLGFANLLQNSELGQQQKEFVDAIVSSGQSLLRVINEVLDLSKIEAGHMELEHHSFSLQSCVEEALDAVSSQAANKGIDLAAHVFAEVPDSLIGDSQRLKQVIINLLGNAVKFTMEGGVKLEVNLAQPSSELATLNFSVADTGVGIAAEKIDQLFGAYQQEDASVYRRFGGSGLGLAISKNLVELMGGKIAVESQQGVGSTFSFALTLPVSREQLYQVDFSQTDGLVGRRVALMDPHDLSRHVIAELLTRWGMVVKSFSTMPEMQKFMGNWTPDMVLLDGLSVVPDQISDVQSMESKGLSIFVLSYPTDMAMIFEKFANVNFNTITKPIKVSVMYNAMIENRAKALAPRNVSPNAPLEADMVTPELRILLVEDNAINQKLARTVLSKMGYQADLAVNGKEAVAMAQKQSYDVIFMDIQMPIMDGLEATRVIRENEAKNGASASYIIALTANALVGDAEVYLEAGMNDYLSKPLRIEELRKALEKADRLHEPQTSTTMIETNPTQKAIRELSEQLSPEDAVSLALDFSADLNTQIAAIWQALNEGKIEDARRNAHSLRGNASIFALSDLQEAAKVVEDACEQKQLDVAKQAVTQLEEVAHRSDELLKKVVMNHGAAGILEHMS